MTWYAIFTKYFRFFIFSRWSSNDFMVPLDPFEMFSFQIDATVIRVFARRSHWPGRKSGLAYWTVCVRKPFYKIYVRLAYQKNQRASDTHRRWLQKISLKMRSRSLDLSILFHNLASNCGWQLTQNFFKQPIKWNLKISNECH